MSEGPTISRTICGGTLAPSRESLCGEGPGEVDAEPVAAPVVQKPLPVHLVDGDARCDAQLPCRVCNLAIKRQPFEGLDAGLAKQDLHRERVGCLLGGGVALLLGAVLQVHLTPGIVEDV